MNIWFCIWRLFGHISRVCRRRIGYVRVIGIVYVRSNVQHALVLFPLRTVGYAHVNSNILVLAHNNIAFNLWFQSYILCTIRWKNIGICAYVSCVFLQYATSIVQDLRPLTVNIKDGNQCDIFLNGQINVFIKTNYLVYRNYLNLIKMCILFTHFSIT